MTSQPGKQIIAIQTLPSRIQTMKFGHLTEYDLRTLLKKSCAKCGGETIPRPISKKSKLSLSLDQ